MQGVSLNEKRITALTDVSALIFLACSNLYNDRNVWRLTNEDPTDSDWDDISKAIGNAEREIMANLVGMIVPHVMQNAIDLNLLPCDGSVYLREDYPLLYEAIHTDLIIDADSYYVPDLRDRFMLGSGTIAGVGDAGGEENHTLDVGELPAHSHTSLPHSHTEGIATPFPTLVGAGAPAVYAVSGVGVTSSVFVTIEEEGGSLPHNNMPPYYTVLFSIIAG
jgi:microcystin-dependent protein